jgi:hypothetical protein
MDWKTRAKQEFDKNPIAAVGVGAMAVTAAAKLIDALSAAQGRRAYAKQINHKVRQQKR